ncbi:MAG TPA: hypothetical protein PL034_02020 [Candidatus Paceibacterota bacterium]|nr:hypothetical protein [Candidatus Paceibacterota bacterium]
MKPELKEEINKIMLGIPERNRLAISSIDWAHVTKEIGEKYYLNEEELDLLMVETALVLLGLKDYDLFKLAIEDMGLSQNDIRGIAKETEDKIFNPISKKIIDSIKKEAELNNTSWDKRVNFILSGGDYTNFIK